MRIIQVIVITILSFTLHNAQETVPAQVEVPETLPTQETVVSEPFLGQENVPGPVVTTQEAQATESVPTPETVSELRDLPEVPPPETLKYLKEAADSTLSESNSTETPAEADQPKPRLNPQGTSPSLLKQLRRAQVIGEDCGGGAAPCGVVLQPCCWCAICTSKTFGICNPIHDACVFY